MLVYVRPSNEALLEGARSGSTGPTWVSFPSFSSCAFCEQEGHLAAPSQLFDTPQGRLLPSARISA